MLELNSENVPAPGRPPLLPCLRDGSDSLPSFSFHDNSENNIQPFFVLHRGCPSSSSLSRPKSRRKLNEESVHEFDDHYLYNSRIRAFHYVWSNIDTTIKGVLKEINLNIFNELRSWVHQSFIVVRSCGEPGYAEATHPYPIALDALSKQIFTGLVYTKNVEFVDDQLTFEELGNHLKSGGCHVANMSSLDFSAKNGISGCLTRLLRKFLKVTLDEADMSILASWYCGQRESSPVVIIIEDMERCCASVLSNFIMMLSKWVVKIPVILVMGVATTLYSPENLLSSNALLCLRTCKFVLGSPAQRMDAIAEAVLLRPCSRFNVGHKVAVFMKDYFLKHDGTLTSFIRALKISCMLLFLSEPLSFLLKDLDAEDDFQEICKEKHAFIQDIMLKHSSQLLPCRGDDVGEPTSENLIHAIGELKILHQCWATVVKCLHEAGKHQNVQLLDLYCDALDPDVHKSGTSYKQGRSSRNGCLSSQHGGSPKRPSICKVVNKVRDLSPVALSELLNNWERHADDVCEIGDKVKELQVMMNSADSKSSGSDLMQALSVGPAVLLSTWPDPVVEPEYGTYNGKDNWWLFASNHFHVRTLEAIGSSILKSQKTDAPKDPKLWNCKAVALIEWMIRDQMKPIESFPFHEILCFKIVDKLQTALLGDPRKRIQADLLEFHKYLCCNCCSTRGSRLLPSLHDTAILYVLAQEHGDIINVHDWFQSFKAILVNPPTKARSKSKHSSTPKKNKDINNLSEAAIQARFCKAVSELQVTGLLRMPTKRRPDFVQRVAFGL